MTRNNDPEHLTDDELIAELAAAVAEADDVSERRRNAAYGAFTWRTVEEELAELLHDSALDAGAAVRSLTTDTVRTLAFGSGSRGLTLEVEVDGDAVLGEVSVAGGGETPARVTMRRPGADPRHTEVDEMGFFRFADVGRGPVRFVIEHGRWSLTSPWVVI